jgi:hypothetical protein
MNATKPVDAKSFEKDNPKGYKIESDIPNGLIDGYFMGGPLIDPVHNALKHKNVKRHFYDTCDIVFAPQKNAKGIPVGKALSEGLKRIKFSDEKEKIMGKTGKAGVCKGWKPCFCLPLGGMTFTAFICPHLSTRPQISATN